MASKSNKSSNRGDDKAALEKEEVQKLLIKGANSEMKAAGKDPDSESARGNGAALEALGSSGGAAMVLQAAASAFGGDGGGGEDGTVDFGALSILFGSVNDKIEDGEESEEVIAEEVMELTFEADEAAGGSGGEGDEGGGGGGGDDAPAKHKNEGEGPQVAEGKDKEDEKPVFSPYVPVMRSQDQASSETDDDSAVQGLITASSGKPLPEAVAISMQQVMGHSFRHVMVHTDAHAAAACEAANAEAMAVGSHLFFSQGAWQPGTPKGDKLIAHELTHVIQYDNKMLRNSKTGGFEVSDPGERAEVEAVAFANHADLKLRDIKSGKAAKEEDPKKRRIADGVNPEPASMRAAGKQAKTWMRESVDPQGVAFREANGPDPMAQLTEEQRALMQPRGDAAPGEKTEGTGQPVVEPTAPKTADAANSADVSLPEITGPKDQGSPGTAEVTPATTRGPQGEAAQLGTNRKPDGLVDYYMETHWDRSEFDQKVDELDLGTAFGSAIDRFMPESTSPEVRSAANTAYSISTGVLDAAIIGGLKAIPGVGSVLHLATGIKDIWSAADTYSQLDDGWGLTINVLRASADMVGSIVGNLGDLTTVIEDVAILFSWTGVGAAIAGIAAWCATWGDAIGGVCDGIKLACSTISTVRNVMMANEAEREGDFRKAAQYRQLASGDALNVVVDGIAVAATVGSALSGNTIPGEAPEDIAEALKKMGEKAMFGAMGVNPDNGLKTTGSAIGRSKHSIGAHTETFQNLQYHLGLGDAMAYDEGGLLGGQYVDPQEITASGPAGSLLAGARQATVQEFTETNATLEANDPAWNQKLVNDSINPPDMTALNIYSKLLSPTAWAEAYAGFGIAVFQETDNLVDGAAGGILDLMAQGVEGAAMPAVGWLNGMISTYKPALDEVLLNMTQAEVDQKAMMDFARSSLGEVDSFLDVLNAFADEGGTLDSFLAGAAARVEGSKQTAESLGIPSWVPASVYSWALDRFNGFLDTILEGIEQVAEEVRPQIDTFIEQQTEWAQAQVEEIQLQLREGGEVEQLLAQGVETIRGGLIAFQQLVADWDPKIELNLQETVNTLRNAATTQRDDAFDNRMEQFREWLAGEGQSRVDSWRGEYSDEVETMYTPSVPTAEATAVDQAYGMINARLAELNEDTPEWNDYDTRRRADAAYAAAQQSKQGQGREAVTSFWSNADRLAQIAASIGA